MQAGIEEAQRGLTEARIEGSVAGGAVSVTVDGTGELVGVEVRPGTVDGDHAWVAPWEALPTQATTRTSFS